MASSRVSQILLLLFLFVSLISGLPMDAAKKPTPPSSPKALPPLQVQKHAGTPASWSFHAGPQSPKSPPPSPNTLNAQAKATFEQTKVAAAGQRAKAKEDGDRQGAKMKTPITGAALHLPGVGTFFSSSIKGGDNNPSSYTKDVAVNGCKGKYKGKCAEMAVIAKAHELGHVTTGGTIATYGGSGKQGRPKPPCPNCEKDIKLHGVTAVVPTSPH